MDREMDTQKQAPTGVRFTGDGKACSKYFTRFAEAQQHLRLAGDNILVEKLPKPDLEQRTASGIILPTEKSSRYARTHADDLMEFGLVLAVGPGQHIIGETGQLEILPCTCKPGDIILLTDNIEWYSQFGHMVDYDPNTIGRIRDANVMMFFSDYMAFIEVLNGTQKTDTL